MLLFTQTPTALCANIRAQCSGPISCKIGHLQTPKVSSAITAVLGHCVPSCLGTLTKSIQLTWFHQSPQAVRSISPMNSWVSMGFPCVQVMPVSSAVKNDTRVLVKNKTLLK